MKCNVKVSPLERVFEISQDFTASDEERFFEIFIAIRRMTEPCLVFDFEKCTFIEPASMGMLVIACEEAAKRNIKRVIKNASPSVKKLLIIAKIDQLYSIQ